MTTSGFSSLWRASALALALLGLSACASHETKSDDKRPYIPVYYGLAVLQSTEGSTAAGSATFSEAFGKVKIEIRASGLDISSKHGVHIHEFGDCTAPDAASAGGHYNPDGREHGGPQDESRHIGDLGNLVSDKNGEAKLTIDVPKMSINGFSNPVLGRSVIIHKNVDDLLSQPSGGSGARIACGVIGAAATGVMPKKAKK